MTDTPDISRSYFLSYSRADEGFALRFATDLRAADVAVWVDQFDIRPSEHWDRAIERAVRDCCGVIVILSPRSVASDNVADEISYAIDSGKSVLPVMIERCTLPLRITRMHMIDATGNYDRALLQCLAEITRSPGKASPDAPVSAPRAAPLAPEVIAKAKHELTPILGPIADILVDRAASRAEFANELYGELASHIEDEQARERFLAHAGDESSPAAPRKPASMQQAAPAIAAADVDRIASAATNYLGPIAPIVARREIHSVSSADDLRQRLAALIPDERERADFLKQTNGRGSSRRPRASRRSARRGAVRPSPV